MPSTARGNRGALSLGPGFLFWLPLGSTEITDLTTAWPAAAIPLGYTAEGTTWSTQTSYDGVEVAEEIDMIDSVPTGREIKVSFSLAEVTSANLKRVMNGGTITIAGTGGLQVAKFEPPDMGEETNCAIGWEAEDHKERFLWRQCRQTGSVEQSRKKGADKALLPAEFNVYAPAAGGKPFVHFSNRGLATV